jgi:hypothetical protein
MLYENAKLSLPQVEGIALQYYLAGILDTRVVFTIDKRYVCREKKTVERLTCLLLVQDPNKELLEFLQHHLGGHIDSKNQGGSHSSYRYTILGREIDDVLEKMQSKMFFKKDQTSILLKFRATLSESEKNRNYDIEITEEREELYKQLRVLKGLK